MQFTRPNEGKPVPSKGDIQEESNSASLQSSQEGKQPSNTMTFHGDTTQIDIRKGKPITIQESVDLEKQAQKKNHHGCLYRAVMILIGIVALLILLVVGVGLAFKNKITPYLAEETLPIPEVSVDSEQLTTTQTALSQINGKLPFDTTNKEIILTKDQVNQWIAYHQITNNFPGKGYINFPSDNNIVVYGTVPLGNYSLGIFKDKWLNVIVQLSGSYHDTLIDGEIVKIMVGNKDATELYRQATGTLKLAQFQDDPELMKNLERFEKIYVTKNKIYFIHK